MLFAVSNFFSYKLIEATDEFEAAVKFSRTPHVRRLHIDEIDDAVIAAMVCLYRGDVEYVLERCRRDVQRVILMNNYCETVFFEKTQLYYEYLRDNSAGLSLLK